MKKYILAALLSLPSFCHGAFTTDWLRNTSSTITINGSTYTWSAGDGGPGKFLQNDGRVITSVTPAGGGGGPAVAVQDEGSYITTVGTINFVGAGVAAALTGTSSVTVTIAGGGTPGGSNTQLQYNNAGSFGGIASATYSVTTNVLTIGATTIFSNASTTTWTNVSTMTMSAGTALVLMGRVGVGGVPYDEVGGTSPTNYTFGVRNGDVKISGTDRGTLFVERTSGAPSAGGGSHVKIAQFNDYAPADVSMRAIVQNSTNGYVGFTAQTSSNQWTNDNAEAITLMWAGGGPTSGFAPGYDNRHMGGVIVSGTGHPGYYYVAGSSLALITDGGPYPIQFYVEASSVASFASDGLRFKQGYGVVGVTNAPATVAGVVGEYKSSTTAGSTNFPTSTVAGDLASISLTAGEWALSSIMYSDANGATINAIQYGISPNSGNNLSNLSFFENRTTLNTLTTSTSQSIPFYRVNISATTTYYLKYYADYSVATPRAQGGLFAHRIR